MPLIPLAFTINCSVLLNHRLPELCFDPPPWINWTPETLKSSFGSTVTGWSKQTRNSAFVIASTDALFTGSVKERNWLLLEQWYFNWILINNYNKWTRCLKMIFKVTSLLGQKENDKLYGCKELYLELNAHRLKQECRDVRWLECRLVHYVHGLSG